ncbi:MAG: glycogen/starch synthase, partial [Candidatus Izemoplasmatales bacterium]|nr:glycogen/starch synthase [Candidatus Izemoplasmatales bacterium]
VSPANIVWNVDYNVILHHHLVQGADITEVLNASNERLRTFLLSKKTLLEYIEHFDSIKFRNLTEVFDYALGLRKTRYVFEEPSFIIDTPEALFRANMNLLDVQLKGQIFKQNRPIFSKETMSSPSRYGSKSFVKHSLVASGAVVNGSVFSSIIGRKATIHEGAHVHHSVVMNQCIIEKGATVEYAILDKETVVKAGAVVKGTLEHIFVSEKKQLVQTAEEITVLQLAVECVPFIKTGGLADVVGALSKELSKQGIQSIVMLPLFTKIKEKYQLFLELIAEQAILYDGVLRRASLYSYNDKQTMFYFIENFDFFERNNIYGYEDDGDRFAFFTKASLAFLDVLSKKPDIIHVHDWHLGLTPLLLKYSPNYSHIKTLLTIHNIEYQGIHSSDILRKVGLESLVYHGHQINYLETGLQHATRISTVSPTYRDELKYEYYSKNLVDLINRRDRDFYGILNGLTDQSNPKTDLSI